jgi:hypothetical protein
MLNIILGGQVLSVVSGGSMSWNVGIIIIAYVYSLPVAVYELTFIGPHSAVALVVGPNDDVWT